MQKIFFISAILIAIFVFSGCTSSADNNTEGVQVSENLIGNDDIGNEIGDTKWSDRVSAFGEPTYEKVEISKGYEILPFPGLTYNGLHDNYQAFYATSEDNNYSIYASPNVIKNAGTYQEVKTNIKQKYIDYGTDVICEDVSSVNWLTEAQTFECNYYLALIDADYKSVIFYKDNSYIETILGVWGTELGTYEYFFDEFNQKAVKWN